jgi:hypothetical protein
MNTRNRNRRGEPRAGHGTVTAYITPSGAISVTGNIDDIVAFIKSYAGRISAGTKTSMTPTSMTTTGTAMTKTKTTGKSTIMSASGDLKVTLITKFGKRVPIGTSSSSIDQITNALGLDTSGSAKGSRVIAGGSVVMASGDDESMDIEIGRAPMTLTIPMLQDRLDKLNEDNKSRTNRRSKRTGNGAHNKGKAALVGATSA